MLAFAGFTQLLNVSQMIRVLPKKEMCAVVDIYFIIIVVVRNNVQRWSV